VVKKRASTRRQATALIGPRKLTRFEKARVVGARALQIALGAPVLIGVDPGSMSPIDIATQELDAGALPISIRRTLPDGTSQSIPLKLVLKPES